jgi:putative peptidoglycan lipid II flippase
MRNLKETGKALALVTVLSAIFYIFAGRFVIDFFLGGGRFGPQQVNATARLLAVFALAVPGESFMHLMVRAFYSLKDTWTPVLIRVPGLALIYVLASVLMPSLGLNALALSYVITISTEVLVLGLLLKRKLRSLT